MNKIEEKFEKLEAAMNSMDHETNHEAKQRQPWMPIGGSLAAALLLMLALGLYMGWFYA